MRNYIQGVVNTTMQKLHKLFTIINIIKLYRTWPIAILDRCNLLKDGLVRHTLRNGTTYLTRAKKMDAGMINAIYIERDYHEHIDKIRDSAVVIDIGANIGAFSIFIQGLAKNVIVYGYEPFKESFDLFQKNIELNNLVGKIRTFNIGVSGKKGTRKLFINKIYPGSSSMFKETGYFIEINTISLKDIFDENNISRCDFLKMDCEGAENEILLNTPKEYLARIESISLEYHDTANINGLVKFLKNSGFEVRFKKRKERLLYAEKKTVGCNNN